jgi:hypothetical protein
LKINKKKNYKDQLLIDLILKVEIEKKTKFMRSIIT